MRDDEVHVVVDTETTGLSVSDGDRIRSIGAVEVSLSGGLADRRMWIVDTDGRKSSPEALAVHRIREDDERSIPEAEAVPALIAFIGDRPVVMQNGAFDWQFINDACDRLGLPRPEWAWQDTMEIARAKHKNKMVNLNSLARLAGIEGEIINRRKKRHEVLDDCVLTAMVWRSLLTPQDFDLDQGRETALIRVDAPILTPIMEW